MRSTMQSLLVLLLCSFCIQADIAMQPDFDLQKFAGMWHIMAGSSNCPVFQGMKSIMTTSAALVKPLPNGDMKILTGYPFPEECKKVEMYFKKTDQPAHFTNDENAKRDMRVLETDYTNFALLYTFKEIEDEPSSTTVQLYTRTQDISNEVLEKFKEHYHKVGLTDDLMVILPKSVYTRVRRQAAEG
ncbi:lipocalin-15-like [Zootoca vivipara]|uniref:lipocalin-15-like n=1 Tax=Zootoca vivipara TaxID=8524 RepID=UPI00293C0A6C|nr:lipocalin-15-like [Zootoca vivipara]